MQLFNSAISHLRSDWTPIYVSLCCHARLIPQVLLWDRCWETEVTAGCLGIAQQTYSESWHQINTHQLRCNVLPTVEYLMILFLFAPFVLLTQTISHFTSTLSVPEQVKNISFLCLNNLNIYFQ